MDFVARFIRERYLKLEEQEAAPLTCAGESHIDGRIESAQRNYYADEGSLSRAKRVALERAHAAALREDAARLSSPNGKPHGETSGQAERPTLGRSLVASIAIAGIRYEITPKGREALQSVLTFQTKEATGSEAAGGQSGTHG